VNLSNAPDLVKRGADILIMGAAVFRAESPEEVVRSVKRLKR